MTHRSDLHAGRFALGTRLRLCASARVRRLGMLAAAVLVCSGAWLAWPGPVLGSSGPVEAMAAPAAAAPATGRLDETARMAILAAFVSELRLLPRRLRLAR